MNLDAQIRSLVENAPQDGTTPRLVEAVAPAMKALAGQLRHEQYYVLQSSQGQWRVTALSNRDRPDLEKTVIYAFPSLQDAQNAARSPETSPAVVAVPLPVTHILFQMMAFKTVDSLIFFETPGNLQQGAEVHNADLQKLVNDSLGQYFDTRTNRIPPNMA